MLVGCHPLGAGGEEFIVREWKTQTVFIYCLSEDLQGGSKIWELGHSPHPGLLVFQCTVSFVCLYFSSILFLVFIRPSSNASGIHTFVPALETSTRSHLTYLLSLSFVLDLFLVCAVTWKELKRGILYLLRALNKHPCLSKERVNPLFLQRMVHSLRHPQLQSLCNLKSYCICDI